MREKIFSSKTARRKRKERKGKTHLFSFSCSVMSNSLQSHELQHARPLCISPSPGVCANSCPLSQWCQPNILSSAIPFSSCLQSFPASGLFQWVSSSHQVVKVLELQLQHQSFQWIQFSSVQSPSCVQLFLTPWTAARQASLSITNSRSSPKLMSIELLMPSNHLILCHPLLLQTSIFPSIRVFSSEWVLCVRWPKYWSFSLNISPSKEHPGLISFRMDWLGLLAVQGTLKSLL